MPLAIGVQATGDVRNSYAILRQVQVGRTSLDRNTSQEEQHEGKFPFNTSAKINFFLHSKNLFSYISIKALKDLHNSSLNCYFASYLFI